MNTQTAPTVSVAIITYNQKQYLRECIESVLSQTYTDYEIVIADDGSTDGTQEMLQVYRQENPDLFTLCLSDTNRGITENSNSAHFACRGKYIAWIGGDDVMLPAKIQTQAEFMDSHDDCTICYHDLDVFDDTTDDTLYLFSEKHIPREGQLATCVKYGTFNGASSTMVRRTRTPSYGFNTALPVASDWLYWVECLRGGGRICYINQTLGRYRKHDNNVTNKPRGTFNQDVVDHLNSCNYILACEPDLLDEVMFRQAQYLRGIRHYLPYSRALKYSLKLHFSGKAFVALLTYRATIGCIRL